MIEDSAFETSNIAYNKPINDIRHAHDKKINRKHVYNQHVQG